MQKRSYQHPCNEDGQFQKKCGCSIHLDNLEEKYEIFKTSSVNCKKGYKNLVDEGLIDWHASYVCKYLLKFYARTMQNPATCFRSKQYV